MTSPMYGCFQDGILFELDIPGGTEIPGVLPTCPVCHKCTPYLFDLTKAHKGEVDPNGQKATVYYIPYNEATHIESWWVVQDQYFVACILKDGSPQTPDMWVRTTPHRSLGKHGGTFYVSGVPVYQLTYYHADVNGSLVKVDLNVRPPVTD